MKITYLDLTCKVMKYPDLQHCLLYNQTFKRRQKYLGNLSVVVEPLLRHLGDQERGPRDGLLGHHHTCQTVHHFTQQIKANMYSIVSDLQLIK